MGRIKSLEELSPADAPLAGGKAYNCARLLQAGFPVPGGFVLMANAIDDESMAASELEGALAGFPEESHGRAAISGVRRLGGSCR